MIIQESKEKSDLVETRLQEDLNQLEMETFEIEDLLINGENAAPQSCATSDCSCICSTSASATTSCIG
jgi:thiazolylpeptide-type bacteriocin precursor